MRNKFYVGFKPRSNEGRRRWAKRSYTSKWVMNNLSFIHSGHNPVISELVTKTAICQLDSRYITLGTLWQTPGYKIIL